MYHHISNLISDSDKKMLAAGWPCWCDTNYEGLQYKTKYNEYNYCYIASANYKLAMIHPSMFSLFIRGTRTIPLTTVRIHKAQSYYDCEKVIILKVKSIAYVQNINNRKKKSRPYNRKSYHKRLGHNFTTLSHIASQY
jgi:hypothetical protein